jgi:hypothetical protein
MGASSSNYIFCIGGNSRHLNQQKHDLPMSTKIIIDTVYVTLPIGLSTSITQPVLCSG